MTFRKWIRRHWGSTVALLFLSVIAWLLWEKLSTLDWALTLKNIAETPWQTTLIVLVSATASYSIFTMFDWLELKKAKSHPPVTSGLMSALVCYAVNFNFGSILGGVGMRLKLYSDLDVSKTRIARIVTLSTLSNWLGYCLFGGAIFLLWPQALAAFPVLNDVSLEMLGYIGLTIVAVVLLILFRQKSFHLRNFEIQLPSTQEGLLRLAMGVANWSAVSLIFAAIFSWHYSAPLSIVIVSGLASAIAGVITHIPGGLGVYEATFLASIGPIIGDSQVIAGILYFRFLYYLLPLAFAVVFSIILKINQTSVRGSYG